MKFVNLDESEIIEQPLEKVIARPDYSPVEFVYDDLCSLDSVSVDGIHPSGDDPDLILPPSVNKINSCFKSEYFKISNLFSEIQTYEQKQQVLKNLGILDAINDSSYIYNLGDGLTYNGREMVVNHDLTLQTTGGKLGVNMGKGLYVNPDNQLSVHTGKGLTVNHADSTVEVAEEVFDKIEGKADKTETENLRKALEAENQRAEQAEINLENAVQLLQDETEDLPSLREQLETLVVNDLTTGGVDKALSAEMGKELAKEATPVHEGLMSAEDKKKLDKLFPVQSYITSGNIRIDTLEKKIYCEDIRVIDTTAKVIISGSSSLTNIIYDYNSLYSSTLPINLALMVNPETSTSFITNGESDEVLYKIYDGYVIIGYFRTISNTLLCSIDKYSVDGVVYYNTVDERIWIQDNPKFYSLPILDKTDVPFAQDKVLFQNGTLESSSLNVSDFIVALPGIVLYNLRTPGNTEYYAAITFYDDRKRCIGYYNGAALSVISEYMPVISDDCRYLRFTTEKGTNPSISFKPNYLTSLEHKVDTIKSDTINAIRGNKLNISNTPNAIINISDGTLTISSSYQSSVSDYINVKGINKICLYNLRTPGSNLYAAIIGYDDNKNIVTSFRSVNTVEDIYEYSIPNGVSYIRFTSNDLATLYSFDIRPKESIIIIGSSSAQRLEKNDLGNFSLSLLQDSPIYWRGVGGENMQAITARSGITPLFPKADFSIPAVANERVEISGFVTDGKDCVFTNQQGNDLPKLNPVVINGVEGSIVYDNSKFYFYRFESGESVEVVESDVISPNDVKFREAILVAMLGYNGGYTGTEEYVSYHEKARGVFNNSKYLFITRLCDGSWTNITTIKEEEDALTARYGTNVLKLRDWLSRFGVKYAISLGLLSLETSQDISDRENGYVPTSLRGDGVHLNNIGYQVLSYKINELLRLISK